MDAEEDSNISQVKSFYYILRNFKHHYEKPANAEIPVLTAGVSNYLAPPSKETKSDDK